MKKVFALFMTVIFTLAAALPAHLQAAPVKPEIKLAAGGMHDCEKHQNKNSGDKQSKCCDKNMCDCVGGNCNFSKLINGGNVAVIAFSNAAQPLDISKQFFAQSLDSKLRRPPKA